MKLKAVNFILLTLISFNLFAQPVPLDKVAAVVDQGVVLESEIEELISDIKQKAAASGQKLPSDDALRIQTIDRLVLVNLQLQQANRMGIQISDPQLDQTISNIARQENKTVDQKTCPY